MNARDYVNSGEHLPPELRDFHDAKLFFKWLVWEKVGAANEKLKAEGKDYSASMLTNLDFVSAQVFTIDYFLWFMGMFGYKLQRVRKPDVEFFDLAATMRDFQEQLIEKQSKMLSEAISKGVTQ